MLEDYLVEIGLDGESNSFKPVHPPMYIILLLIVIHFCLILIRLLPIIEHWIRLKVNFF